MLRRITEYTIGIILLSIATMFVFGNLEYRTDLQVWPGVATFDQIWGYAEEDASGIENTPIRYTRNTTITTVEGNLEDADGDHILGQGDRGVVYDLRFDANHLGPGIGGWHFDIFDSRHVMITDFRSTYILPDSIEDVAVPGDTNAIVQGIVVFGFQPLTPP